MPAAATTLVANFTIISTPPNPQTYYTIIANATAGGSATGGGTFLPGHLANLVATVTEGYEFVNWTEDGNVVGTELTLGFMVLSNRTLVANFAEIVEEEEEIILVEEPEIPAGPTDPEETILDNPIPQGPATLPKTGEIPAFFFYGLGTALTALGVKIRIRRSKH